VCDRAGVGLVGVPVDGDATTLGELSVARTTGGGGGLPQAEKQKLITSVLRDWLLSISCSKGSWDDLGAVIVDDWVREAQVDELAKEIVDALDSST
jgi:hypothetical protein